jgi:hypothetical protein
MAKQSRKTLSEKPKVLRTAKAAPRVGQVDRFGGWHQAGLIAGVSVLTRGEVQGHELWVDAHMLTQVADAINAHRDGIKSRFTHPGLSDDGLGKVVGRVTNARVQDNHVVADLHMMQSAHETPDGDLAEYVMRLAEEDPGVFGLSIVFRPDEEAEQAFVAAHTVDGAFRSPDPDNHNHWPHARVATLHAVDFVDEPAANPNGLFHRDDAGERVFAFLDYCAGLRDEEPALQFDSSVAPSRVRRAVARWFQARGVQIVRREEPPEKDAETAPALVSAEEIKRFVEAFGAQGATWLAEGKTWAECQALHAEAQLAALREQLAQVEQQRNELQRQLAQACVGEREPVTFCPEDGLKQPSAAAARTSLTPALQRYAAGLRLSSEHN